jgi:hypothetical protein
MEEGEMDTGEIPPSMDETPEPQGEFMENEEPSTPFQNEFRTITSKPVNPPPQDMDEGEDLFSDAAETRTKKLGY